MKNRNKQLTETLDSMKSNEEGYISRRQALSTLGGAVLSGAAIFTLASCSSDSKTKTSGTDLETSTTTSTTTSKTASSDTLCSTLPQETAGPFPGDGSNSNSAGEADVLAENNVVRSDIRSNLDGSNTQDGAPMTLNIKVVDASNSCAALGGYSVYLWHANREGNYSMYSSNGANHTDDTFLRGVQITDSNGDVTFKTILPGRYSGRASHFHFEVYADSNYATGKPVLTSQFAFDDIQADSLYKAAAGYIKSTSNATYNKNDNVFSDGFSTQLLEIKGDVTSGLTGTITVGI